MKFTPRHLAWPVLLIAIAMMPDGSDLETFCGGGMDNPVEVAFTAEGEMIGTMTFYNPDAARQDALVHFVYGGVYPRKHPCTSEFKQTGPLMPALSRFGGIAASTRPHRAASSAGRVSPSRSSRTARSTPSNAGSRYVALQQGTHSEATSGKPSAVPGPATASR